MICQVYIAVGSLPSLAAGALTLKNEQESISKSRIIFSSFSLSHNQPAAGYNTPDPQFFFSIRNLQTCVYNINSIYTDRFCNAHIHHSSLFILTPLYRYSTSHAFS